MIRPRNASIARYSAMFLLAVSGVGCATKPAPGPDLNKEPLLIDRGDRQPFLALIERPIFVDLPDSRTNTLTRSQWEGYLYGRRMVSHIRQRCVDMPNERHECNRTVAVQITAVEGAKYIEWRNHPRRPQLIAWIENLSRSETTFDGLLPGPQAHYALVVDSRMGLTERRGQRPVLLRVGFRSTARYETPPSVFAARASVYGHVFECHNYRQPYLSDVDFRPCAYGHASAGPGTLLWKGPIMITSLVTFAADPNADDPTWLSCTSGCCSSSAPM